MLSTLIATVSTDNFFMIMTNKTTTKIHRKQITDFIKACEKFQTYIESKDRDEFVSTEFFTYVKQAQNGAKFQTKDD